MITLLNDSCRVVGKCPSTSYLDIVLLDVVDGYGRYKLIICAVLTVSSMYRQGLSSNSPIYYSIGYATLQWHVVQCAQDRALESTT